jgi:AmiR/NasT family two-component response regulator
MDNLYAMMIAADQALDRAWKTGHDICDALEHAKELSRALGGEPLIEDAKLLIADAQHCTPNEAFLRLACVSQVQQQPVAHLARDIVATAEATNDRRQPVTA